MAKVRRDFRTRLKEVKSFNQLIAFLRDELNWPIDADDFKDVDDLFYDFTAEELGIESSTAVKIREIKRLKSFLPNQPWGIFFVKFEPKQLPVVALRRILSRVAVKKRAGANRADLAAWSPNDLLFVSNYGDGEERQICFAHFAKADDSRDLPTLKVLGWNNRDTALHLDAVALELKESLSWPDDVTDLEAWRLRWRSAFSVGHKEVVSTSRELSVRLAELARAIRDRIESALKIEAPTGPLTRLMKAFQTSLIHDLSAEDFADMYAQTIAYGLLSSRIADPTKKTADDFADHMGTSPFLRDLMTTFLRSAGQHGSTGRAREKEGIDFDELGVSEVIALLDSANMEAVIRDFGNRNPREDPVIHFYEWFLKAYDPKRRMQRGVFYTPRPVVTNIVESIDERLRTEFGLSDGLADTSTWGEVAAAIKDLRIPSGVAPNQEFVQILDPAVGTGTFLVEVIDKIFNTLEARWQSLGHDEDARTRLWNEYVPNSLLTRLHGFELLMAPYAIAHLKIGLKLFETGYRFESEQRTQVFLTNSLEPPANLADNMAAGLFVALGEEAQACNSVKRSRKFTVVLGNPPYAGHSSNPTRNKDGSLTYIGKLVERYFQFEGAPLQEKQPKWLHDDYVKFFRLGEHLLLQTGCGVFGMVTNHGFIGNPTFRGMRESLISTFAKLWVLDLAGNSKKSRGTGAVRDENVFDIEQGTAITVGVVSPEFDRKTFRFANLIGLRTEKYDLLSSESTNTMKFAEFEPTKPFLNLLPMRTDLANEWFSYQSLAVLMPLHALGVVSGRDDFAISIDRTELIERLEVFCDAGRNDSFVAKKFAIKDAGGYELKKRRKLVIGGSGKSFVRRVSYRPFDLRFIGYSRGFLTADQNKVMRHLGGPTSFALSTTRTVETGSFAHVFCTREIMVNHCVSLKEANYVFPLYLQSDESNAVTTLFDDQVNLAPNLLPRLTEIVTDKESQTHSKREVSPENFAHYTYAILHSPTYRARFEQFLQSEFPRIPFTGRASLFWELVRLGEELVRLHLLESPKLNSFGDSYQGGRAPAVGKPSFSDKTIWISEAKQAGFRGVSDEVWEFRVGGYQVCEKWLKDRKGRKLLSADIAHFARILAAIAETVHLMQEIDDAIVAHGNWSDVFLPITL